MAAKVNSGESANERAWPEALLEQAPNIIIGLGEESKVLIFNKAAERITGYRAKEVLGKQWIEIFIPEKRKEDICAVWDTIVKNKLAQHRHENPILTKKGEERLISWNNTVILEKKKFKMVLSIGEDVTERKKAEEKIIEEKILNSAIIENAPFGIITFMKDGSVDYVNPAMLEIAGAERNHFNKMNAFKLPTYVEMGLSGKVKDCFAGKPFFMGPVNYISHFSGKKTVRNFTGIPMRDDHDEIVKVMLFVEDITLMKESDEKLQKQQREQQIMLDSVPAWIFFKDKENRFIRVNKVFSEMMHLPREKIEGKSCFEIFPKEQAEAFWRDDNEVILSGKPKTGIIEPVNTRKGLRWAQTDKMPYYDAQGDIIGVVGFVVDITERKKAEDELKRRTDELERFNNLAMGRELRMIELKKMIKELESEIRKLRNKEEAR